MEAVRETLIIAGHELRHAVRTTRAILFLLIYALVSIVAGAIMVWAISEIHAQLGAQLGVASGLGAMDLQDEKTKLYRELMTFLVGDEEQASYLTAIPMVVLFFFWGTRNFLPWLAVLMGYDQVSGELQNRSTRYLLLRARRGSMVLGKVLSLLALLIGLTVVTNVLVFTFAAVTLEGFELRVAALHLVRFWLLTLPIGLCWIALMSLISSSFRSPYISLLVGLTALVCSGVVGWMARIVEPLSALRWLVPWHYGGYLLSHRFSDQLFGVSGFLAFALLFTAASYLVLRRRDV